MPDFLCYNKNMSRTKGAKDKKPRKQRSTINARVVSVNLNANSAYYKRTRTTIASK